MPRTLRKYGLFERRDGKWVRLYPALHGRGPQEAARIFQSALLASALSSAPERRIRPIS